MIGRGIGTCGVWGGVALAIYFTGMFDPNAMALIGLVLAGAGIFATGAIWHRSNR